MILKGSRRSDKTLSWTLLDRMTEDFQFDEKIEFSFFFFKFFQKKKEFTKSKDCFWRGDLILVDKDELENLFFWKERKIGFFFEKIQSFWKSFLKKTTNITDQSSFSSLILLIFWVWFKINFFFFFKFSYYQAIIFWEIDEMTAY